MTVAIPPPIPLDMPPGDVDALGTLVQHVAGAAFWLATLGERLVDPAASAPDWLGDDAAAATAQIERTAALTRACSSAVLLATGRLSAHHQRLADARNRVVVLREEQDEDFRSAWRRLGSLDDYEVLMRTGAPVAAAVVEELAAAEARRRHEHTGLLDELAADTAATARALADSSAVVGGNGRRGDGSRVVAYLAAELPGWGDPELTARGGELALALGGDLDVHAWEELARQARPYARSAAFADALLSGLGPEGVRQLLVRLGGGRFGDDLSGRSSAVAGLLAAAFGAARPGSPHDPVADVLAATYVSTGDPNFDSDLVVLGMAAVLAAASGGHGPGASTVAQWGRQILARERAFDGEHAESRVILLDDVTLDLGHVDVVPRVVDYLARYGGPGDAAALLGERESWDALLARSWDDGAASLLELVARAGTQPGAAGDLAVRAGLESLGSGLDDGNPADWTVDRYTAALVAPALGVAVAAHVTVATDVLWSGVRGELSADGSDAIRGLGYLTLDEGAAVAVHKALEAWALIQPGPAVIHGDLPLFPGVVVPAAYVAVEEYGQRLAYALHGFEMQSEAEDNALFWNLTVGLGVTALPGRGALVGGVLANYAAGWLGMDGTWDNGPDRGMVFARPDAVDAAVGRLTPDQVGALRELGAQAGNAYDRTAEVLGLPKPPTSPVIEWWQPLVDALMPGPTDLLRLTGNFVKEMRAAGVLGAAD